MQITKEYIENLRANGAPVALLDWLSLRPRTFADLHSLGDSSIAVALFDNEATTLDIYEHLFTIAAGWLRCALAGCKRIPVQMLSALAKDKLDSVRIKAAASDRLPVDDLVTLATDPVMVVQLTAIRNCNFPQPLMAQYASGTNDLFCLAVAGNLGATPEILMNLAAHPNADVRCTVARHIDLPLAAMHMLRGDFCESVRLQIACHPKATSDVLDPLLVDRDVKVRTAAVQHPIITADHILALKGRRAYIARMVLAGLPTTPVVILWRLMYDSSWQVRRATGKNPRLPSIGRTALRGDRSAHVRAVVGGGLDFSANKMSLLRAA